MNKIIIAALVFIACQCIALLILSDVNSSSIEEVDMEIYEFEHAGHDYLIFEEQGETISVIHDPNCKCKTIQ